MQRANSPLDFNMFLTDMNSPPVPDLSHMFNTQQRRNSAGSQQEHSQSPFGNAQPRSQTPFLGIDDPAAYGLDPASFTNSVSFAMPSFVSGGPFVGDGASAGPAYMEVPSMAPSYTLPQPTLPRPAASTPQSYASGTSRSTPSFASRFKGGTLDLGASASPNFGNFSNPAARQQVATPRAQQPTPRSTPANSSYVPNASNPVYGTYGSSYVSVQPDKKPFATMPPLPVPYRNPYKATSGRPESPGFDARAPGMPQAVGGNFPGLYSSTGFDMLGVLARVAARPNPQINIGPVDTSASFLVVDARRFDFPIVSASQTFSALTGYALHEIIGRNCRFLQSPTGEVAQGAKRKYTDANAAYHMKTHILSGKECQASVINYRKDGTPFINLITIIPITWDTDEISYFVGFQVDLVEQPNAILEKMKDGTYVVNYSLLPNQPFAVGPNAAVNAAQSTQRKALEAAAQEVAARSGVPGNFGPTSAAPSSFQLPADESKPAVVASSAAPATSAQPAQTAEPSLEAALEAPFGDEEDVTRRAWYKLVLENSGDFIHVLSLKGSFLYVSPMAARSLEYEPAELVGKTIQAICHPSDIVPVMRELKDSGSGHGKEVVNLLYRIRRKQSGYVWIEAQGKLHIEQGKGRKCVILLGRQRSVYSISWSALGRAGGLGDHEFWGKVSLDGMWLYSTSKVSSLLGLLPHELVGTSVVDLIPAAQRSQYTAALSTAAAGTPTSLRHELINRRGDAVTFVTTFHASTSDSGTAQSAQAPWIVIQVNTAGSEDRRRRNQQPPSSALMPPNRRSRSSSSQISIISGGSDAEGQQSDSSNAPSTYSAVPSTFKTLAGHPSMISDNMFDELDTTRSTSWQFELHQLQLTNKKLREERDMLQSIRRKRQRRNEELGGVGPSRTAKNGRVCANCGRTDSPEWRSGPTGKASLCNACGLRWTKSVNRSGSASAPPTPSGEDEPAMAQLPGTPMAPPQL